MVRPTLPTVVRRGVQRDNDGAVRWLRPEYDKSLMGDGNTETLALYTAMTDDNRAACIKELAAIHAGLVFAIAKQGRFKRRGLEFTERVQEGFVGLMKAINKFDPSRGFTFATYASYWVRQTIGRACWSDGFNGRSHRASYNADSFAMLVAKTTRQLRNQLGRPPTDDEIVDVMHDPQGSKRMPRSRFLAKVRAAQERLGFSRFELNGSTSGKDGKSRKNELADDFRPPADVIIEALELVDLCRGVLMVDALLITVFDLRFGIDGETETYTKIAHDLGYHRTVIKQAESRLLRALSHELDVTREEIVAAVAIRSLTS